VSVGYLHSDYARSLGEFGTPRALSESGGWILEQAVPGHASRDAMGCYPIFCCRDWTRLPADLDALREEIVSVVVVTDPFGEYDSDDLRRCFPDLVRPFKAHYVVDLHQSRDAFVHPHHRRHARVALQRLSVECCPAPVPWREEWIALYANLIQRHHIKGLAAFSRSSLLLQLGVPGLAAFRAIHERETVGMALWYVHGPIAYYHLAAYSDIGYQLRASFALFWNALEHFVASGVRWLNLGAGAGLASRSDDGLSRFKRGWATGTRTAYLCGRIFSPAEYRRLSLVRGEGGTGYFPAYRAGEFVSLPSPDVEALVP
jgi:hypothetical protein